MIDWKGWSRLAWNPSTSVVWQGTSSPSQRRVLHPQASSGVEPPPPTLRSERLPSWPRPIKNNNILYIDKNKILVESYKYTIRNKKIMRCQKKKTWPQFWVLSAAIESALSQPCWVIADSISGPKIRNCGRVFFLERLLPSKIFLWIWPDFDSQ